jgi:hypothetical protein
MAYYAWGPIRAGTAEKPVNVKYGDTVTADKLSIAKEEFAALVESRAVRDTKPPELPDEWQDSPINFLRKQAADAEASETAALLNEDQLEALGENG